MYYEIVDTSTGLVINSIAWDGISGDPVPEGCIAVPKNIDQLSGIGWEYKNGVFIAPIESQISTAIPSVVSRFKARAAMAQAGYFTQVDDFMATLPKTDIRRMAWEDATEFDRTSTTLKSMAEMLGLTETDLDNLFILAAGIEA